ncbi:hypothetical protein BD769DRAFT_1528558 [Suillus cothurnatus]|nr:hypothetical protein BD769DRAFT_1528558 [Suillus cothurnatus]
MKNSFLVVLFFSFAVAVASSLDVQARNPTPSKRYVLPILPRQPGPSTVPKRSLLKRAPVPGPSAAYVAREASPFQPLAAPRQLTASPHYARAAAPDLSRRADEDSESATPQKRSLDEQHVMGGVAVAAESRGFCFDGLVAVPCFEHTWAVPSHICGMDAIGFECVDFTADLRSCGGCSSLDPFEHDCAKIPNVQGVACVTGECEISSCQPGYKLDSDGRACSPTE